MTEPDETAKARALEEMEDRAVKNEEKKKKARLRRRGPYRKAHTDWRVVPKKSSAQVCLQKRTILASKQGTGGGC